MARRSGVARTTERIQLGLSTRVRGGIHRRSFFFLTLPTRVYSYLHSTQTKEETIKNHSAFMYFQLRGILSCVCLAFKTLRRFCSDSEGGIRRRSQSSCRSVSTRQSRGVNAKCADSSVAQLVIVRWLAQSGWRRAPLFFERCSINFNGLQC